MCFVVTPQQGSASWECQDTAPSLLLLQQPRLPLPAASPCPGKHSQAVSSCLQEAQCHQRVQCPQQGGRALRQVVTPGQLAWGILDPFETTTPWRHPSMIKSIWEVPSQGRKRGEWGLKGIVPSKEAAEQPGSLPGAGRVSSAVRGCVGHTFKSLVS